ncbi:hypothetical protein VP1G_08762 [Cytospora mali]|uniref:LYR motif-containing protein Cup1-like N-terminal domain-containing protein n=1 Tax=Cytospora mali TaxID=578113 RepID=A0A194VCG4_CYTMA|nr:hypothetical protein VP1G_08762 [Valsa mali var. pyri (nom. inval.)]
MRLSPLPTLHIYRHLLREVSYLPPICRPYVAKQIRSRFQKHKYDDAHNPETKHRVRRARHDLRFIWAANNGLLNNMHRILLHVFGRTGKRRSELIHGLVRKEPPSDSDELERALNNEREARTYEARDGTLKEREPDWLDKWDTQKIQAFASSQGRKNPPLSPRPQIKSKQVDPASRLPEENIWGRPLAATLARSKLRKEYKALVNRILPPVARTEWDMLRALATGQADKGLWEMPPRRPRAILPDGEHDDGKKTKDWDWQAYATTPVRSIERGRSRSQRARTGEEVDGFYEQGSPRGVHRYTPRLWRRLFAKIWETTPTIEEKPGKGGKSDIVWGQMTKDVPVAVAAHAVFFEGAPEVSKTSGKKRGRK